MKPSPPRQTLHRARRLPKDPGPAAWNALLTPPAPPRLFEGKQTADWLIIGGGFAGLSAARRLAQCCPQDRIILIDAVRIGDGPAGRNSGFMIDLPHDLQSDDYGAGHQADLDQIRQNRFAIDYAAETVDELGLPAESFQRWGKVNAAATAKGEAHIHAFAQHLDSLGESYEILDAQAMAHMTGSRFFTQGLYTPGAVLLQPALYVRSLAQALRPWVQIYENTPALSFARQGQSWLVTTPKGQISASHVILAVNGHANSFGFFKRRLMHVFTYASMTRALTSDEQARLGGAAHWGATPADPMGTTVRKIAGTGGARLVVRNRFTYDPSMEVGAARLKSVARTQRRSFDRRFPQLAGLPMDYVWGGRLCLSLNSVSAVGELDQGLYSAVCQNGLGTAKGTLAGYCAAQLAMGQSDALSTQISTAPAPKRLPPEPIAWLGANATMRYKEYQAGVEL